MPSLTNLKLFKHPNPYKTAQIPTRASHPDTQVKQSSTPVMHAPVQVKYALTQFKHAIAQDKHATTLGVHPSIHTPTPISKKLETSEDDLEDEDVMNMIKPDPEEVGEHWDEMEDLTEDREWTVEQLMDDARPGRRHAA
ncbi:hypothetical protein COCVIDRAFT_88236 [Bipolaris victoriae FI3]|uniref:Uncharacterized protein n=1 Tax=Bipolaris victoriae (strain FI3) TaxID=930091 RepID=W7ET87_BIPV3|nr:hypothetical protein COCVIDRAFT_88236 [Bipolaris victoriae FI3]